MGPIRVTELFVVVTALGFLVIWLAFDLLVVSYLRPKYGTPTITHWIQATSATYPAIPFMTGLILGLICGHLFGQF